MVTEFGVSPYQPQRVTPDWSKTIKRLLFPSSHWFSRGHVTHSHQLDPRESYGQWVEGKASEKHSSLILKKKQSHVGWIIPFLCHRSSVWVDVCVSVSRSVMFNSLWPHGRSPGSSVHAILQTRTIKWVAIPCSRGSSWPWDWTRVSYIAGRFFSIWATREAHEKVILCPFAH